MGYTRGIGIGNLVVLSAHKTQQNNYSNRPSFALFPAI
jgi:hypothetical protein